MNPAFARELNEQLRLLADSLPGDEGRKYGFACEDGCEAIVLLTVSEYHAAGGAWLDGHKPEQHKRRVPE